MAWIRDRVNPDFPDEMTIVLGIDRGDQAGPGDRAVAALLAYGMEGDEGVFHLLPHDLCCRVGRSGGLVTVDLLTMRDEARALGLPGGDDPAEWVTVLSAAIPLAEDADTPEVPIVLIEHDGVAGLDELLATIPEAGVHIIGPKPDA